QTEGSDSKKDGDAAGSAGTEGPSKSDRQARPGDLKSDKDRKGNGGGEGNAGAGGSKDKDGNGSAAGSAIPDGSDDDVVAPRLRKAAEAETDPELKEKLWKEYIEYKKNSK